jgi:uncharacterized protein (TIGR02466 family)
MTDENTTNSKQLKAFFYYPSGVYTSMKPDFLKDILPLYDQYVNKSKMNNKIDELYPMLQTDNIYNEPKAQLFSKYIADTSWEILKSQGYNMENKGTFLSELWGHYYQKFGSMEQHIHNNVYISGFYFLDCPPKSSKVIFHDPNSAKTQTNLQELDISQATYASTTINFEPKPGMFIFTNSWLPHSITRHGSPKPLKFVHFNLGVMDVQNQNTNIIPSSQNTPEII